MSSSLKFTLRNDLKREDVRVDEGNAGVFRQVTILTPGQVYTLSLDPQATYREYVLITLPNKKKLPPLSTDLFPELKEIIVFKEGDTYDWRGTPNRRGRVATALQQFFSKS